MLILSLQQLSFETCCAQKHRPKALKTKKHFLQYCWGRDCNPHIHVRTCNGVHKGNWSYLDSSLARSYQNSNDYNSEVEGRRKGADYISAPHNSKNAIGLVTFIFFSRKYAFTVYKWLGEGYSTGLSTGWTSDLKT